MAAKATHPYQERCAEGKKQMSTSNWRLSINTDTDVAYIRMTDNEVVETYEATDDILVDVDEHDVVVGIEMLRLDAKIPYTDLTAKYHVHSGDIAYLEGLLPSIQVRMEIAADGVNDVSAELTRTTDAASV
jgi:uncharacterized protein YuzE